ncbi:MAG TPA: hypothetical protein VIU82_00305 [Bosea sp. (in: a-proteobacteria)]
MTTLALDLGTTTGYCVGDRREALISGTWSLKPQRFESGGMRYVKFRKQLDTLHSTFGLKQIWFEEVRAHKGVDAAHAYGGFMATLQAWTEDNSVPCAAVPVQAIKKFATGKGNANKEAMMAAVRDLGFEVVDDNHADAIALWLCQAAS